MLVLTIVRIGFQDTGKRTQLSCLGRRSCLTYFYFVKRINSFIHSLLEAIYSYTGQSDIADIIMSRRRKFLAGLQRSQNVVIRHLVSTLL